MVKYTKDQLEKMTLSQLVETINSLNPISPVNRLGDKKSGVERILRLQDQVEDETPPPLEDNSPKSMSPSEREVWIKTEAPSSRFLTNRKEVVLFNAYNPNGLVKTIEREELPLGEDEEKSMEFFKHNGTIKAFPHRDVVNMHRARLVKVLIKNGFDK